MSIVGAQSSGNTVEGDKIDLNGSPASGASATSTVGTGVFIQSAVNNNIINDTIDGSGIVPADKNDAGRDRRVPRRSLPATSSRATSSRGNTAYGVFLYNSARNVPSVARTGKDAVKLSGNRIAQFREFTQVAATGTPAKGKGTKGNKGQEVGLMECGGLPRTFPGSESVGSQAGSRRPCADDRVSRMGSAGLISRAGPSCRGDSRPSSRNSSLGQLSLRRKSTHVFCLN